MCSLSRVLSSCDHTQAESKKHEEWVAEAESKLHEHYEECIRLDVMTDDGQKGLQN